MRVCHIGFNYFPAQGLTIFYEFSRHLASQGVEVIVIAPGRPGEPPIEDRDGMRIHRVPTPSIGRLSFDRLRFVWAAARIIRQHQLDLVHVYAFVGCALLRLLSGRHDAKWIYDCQTSAIKPPLIGLQNWLIRMEALPFNVITALSEGIRDIVFGRSFPIAAIVPLGADFEHFRPRQPDPELRGDLRLSASDVVMVYCGSMDHNRKLHKLIEAFAFAFATRRDLRLLMIGDGSALSELKDLARQLGIDDAVRFTGLVRYEEVPRYLALGDVALAYISMDPCFEHQPPTKTVEYLAQGLPVIATATGGNRMFVQDGENGVLSGDTAESFGDAILSLANQRDCRVALAQNARSSVDSFRWSEIVRCHVLPLYRNILRMPPLAVK